MNLAKIIGELRAELQCLNTAITSMEELARVQSAADSEDRPVNPPPAEPSADATPPVKRRRGRPPKVAAPVQETVAPTPPTPVPTSDDSPAFSPLAHQESKTPC